jgi:putative membrane protein
MFPGDFSLGGWWIIFPIIGIVVMIACMFIMMGRRGFMGPRRDSRREPREGSVSESPLEILKKRYAKGEISKEEYEEMKRDL